MRESSALSDWDPEPLWMLETILEAGRGVTYLMDVWGNDSSMTALQARLAHHVAMSRTGLPLAVLAERLHVSRAAVTQMVNRMARHRLVVRTDHPLDGRCRLVRLTARGYVQYENIVRRLARYDSEVRHLMGTAGLDYVADRLDAVAREAHIESRWL